MLCMTIHDIIVLKMVAIDVGPILSIRTIYNFPVLSGNCNSLGLGVTFRVRAKIIQKRAGQLSKWAQHRCNSMQ